MKKGKEINIKDCLDNAVRWKMVAIAKAVTEKKKEFPLSDILNKQYFEEDFLVKHNRRLREHFLMLIQVGVFTKVEKTYRYKYDANVVMAYSEKVYSHSQTIKELAI